MAVLLTIDWKLYLDVAHFTSWF